MKRYLLAALVLFYAAFLVHGCASVSEATRNAIIEYKERGGLTAEEYHALTEGCDEGLDSLQIEAKYYGGGK